MPYFYVDPKTGAPTTKPPSMTGGEMGGLDFGGEFNFGDVQMPEAPAPSINFDKEAYRESIVAPAEQARKDATLEAIQQASATAAYTGRPAGDVQAEILGMSTRQAGATSAQAAGAAEEAGLKASVAEADLAMQKYQVDVQRAVAQQELKVRAWSVMQDIQSKYKMLRLQLDNERAMLNDRLGFEAGEAEANRRTEMEMKMFEIQSGMAMLQFKEDNANMRAEAGLAADEREALRDHAYKMQYLDAWRTIQGMKTLYEWRTGFGRGSLYTRTTPTEPEANQPTNQGTNWYDIPEMFNMMPP